MVKFGPAAYDRHRLAKVRTYIEFLEANGLTPAKFLYDLAAAP